MVAPRRAYRVTTSPVSAALVAARDMSVTGRPQGAPEHGRTTLRNRGWGDHKGRPYTASRPFTGTICVVGRILLLIACLCACGCTTKRVLEISTNPPGADIWVNGKYLKEKTPVEIPFTHHGFWDIRVEKAGYQSVAKEIEVSAGVDAYPIIDLFAERIRKEERVRRHIEMPLMPKCTEEDVQALLKRAHAFREQTYREAEEADAPERLLPGSGELVPAPLR